MAEPSPRQRLTVRRSWAVAVAALAIVSLSAIVLQPRAAPAPDGSLPPSESAGPTVGPDGEWESVQLENLPAVATLEPSQQDEAGIAPDATFALVSLTAEPATALARRLEISPSTALDIVAAADATRATIAPVAALAPGQVYRVVLRTDDGNLAASWAFRVRSPVRVLSTIPGDRTTAVPVTTGIEVTFDQEKVAGLADFFSISPAVEGRFERHGRTQVFVPSGRLAERTLYTVTIRAGLPRVGTDLTLESDVVFRFETNGSAAAAPLFRFAREVIETSPDEAPILAVDASSFDQGGESGSLPTSADLRVYRLPSEAAATTVLEAFLRAPRWTAFSYPLMPTDGLPMVSRFSAMLEGVADSPYRIIRFPAPLEAGWYIAEIAGARPTHAFLQVTAVSAWVSVLTDRTIVWVNDVVADGPIEGATASIAGGAVFGRSDASGVVNGHTPDALVPAAAAGERHARVAQHASGASVSFAAYVPGNQVGVGHTLDPATLLIVRAPDGGVVLVPFEVTFGGGIYRGEWWETFSSANSTHWSLLLTDRTLYRATDRVEAWGYLRGRDDGTVPADVELRLIPARSTESVDPPALVRTIATPEPAGAFLASLAFERAPLGDYSLQALVDGRVVASRWLQIGVIRKPAYQLALVADRRAVISGTTVRWTATATFFDGTPAPSLRLTASDDAEHVLGPTAATGRASIDLTSRAFPGLEDASSRGLSVYPAGPEESEIVSSADVLVFPSSDHLTASGVVENGQLRVTGSLQAVDLAKVERALTDGIWTGDPSGDPIPGRTINVAVTELVPIRRLVGNDYDFIEKVTRPRYEYNIERRALRTTTVVTGADGRLSFGLAIPDPAHQYEVVLSTKDDAGRDGRRTIQAGAPLDLFWIDAGVRFQSLDGQEAGAETYRVGEQISWRMTDDGVALPSGGADRYLYIVAQRGLRSAAVTDSATFSRPFAAADAPGIFVMGVRFTGSTYAPKAATWARFEIEQREITVAVTVDRERYRPRDDVSLTVRTTDAEGRPIAASVVLQAVDEKLYAIGAASVPRPLQDLYALVDSGIVRLTSTHQVPTRAGLEGEGGATGGGARTDFRDTLVSRVLQTNSEGLARTTIRLSDDLTSWHVTASALTAELQAGVGELLVPVGLPLFADVTVADGYLLSDRPSIRLRAYGEALKAGDPVEFTVTSPSLGLPATVLTGRAFIDVSLDLPRLTLGRHSLDVSVRTPTRVDGAGLALTDRLIRTFSVVESRVTAARSEFGVVGATLPTVGGTEATTYTFTDAGRGRYLPILEGLVEPAGARLDRGLAQSIARSALLEFFGRDAAALPPDAYDPTRYPIADLTEAGVTQIGIALLPYGGPDPWLAARVAIVAPEGYDASQLQGALAFMRDSDGTRRDLQIACIAGLAALGEPVHADLIDARSEPDLTVTERLYLALGFAAIGDDAAALAIERELLGQHGQRLGPWVRLAAGASRDEMAEATSLLALLASGLGDPLAARMIEYVVANPSRETTHALDIAGSVRRVLERTPAAAAAFAYTVDGRRTVVRLKPGQAVTIVLTAAQRGTLDVERLSGEVGVAVTWREPIDLASFEQDPALHLTRTIPPSPIATGRLVTVDLRAELGESAPTSDCYEVVEQVPSGLAPIAGLSWLSGDAGITWPSSVVGQEVSFCVSHGPGRPNGPAHLRYLARIVSEGTFTWEPAVMEHGGSSESITLTPAETVGIGQP